MMTEGILPSRPVAPAAVLWDMDGTLVDTEPYWLAEEFRLVEAHGGTWSDAHAKTLVGSDLMVAARYIQQHSVRLEPEQIVQILLAGVVCRMREHVPWRPGALELLTELRERGVPCALVTMSWTSLADTFLAAAPVGSFDVVVTGDRVARGKPHPDPYLRAAELLGVSASSCVAIEDSPTGVASAEAAGVPTLAVPHVLSIPAAPGRSRARCLTEVGVDDLSRIAGGAVLDLLDPTPVAHPTRLLPGHRNAPGGPQMRDQSAVLREQSAGRGSSVSRN